jgi:hypothetical protein
MYTILQCRDEAVVPSLQAPSPRVSGTKLMLGNVKCTFNARAEANGTLAWDAVPGVAPLRPYLPLSVSESQAHGVLSSLARGKPCLI